MIQIFCDGACVPNPGKGAWAVLCNIPGQTKPFFLVGTEQQTTNNRMEMWGLAASFIIADHFPEEPVKIYCDNTYVINAIAGTQRKTKANKDLIEKFQGIWPLNARVFWVRGHDNNPGNNRVDQIAQAAVNRIIQGKTTDTIFGGWDKVETNFISDVSSEFHSKIPFCTEKNFACSPEINSILRKLLFS